MRELVFGAIMASAVGGGIFLLPYAKVEAEYPLTVDQAVARLSAADPKPRYGPFAKYDVSVYSPKPNLVQYSTAMSGGTIVLCQAEFTAVEGGVKVAKSCDTGDGAFAVGKALDEMRLKGFAELVDAALDGRQYDSEKMKLLLVGSAMRHLPAMQKQALDMQRKVEAEDAAWKAQKAERDAAGGEDIADDWAGGEADY